MNRKEDYNLFGNVNFAPNNNPILINCISVIDYSQNEKKTQSSLRKIDEFKIIGKAI